jgi:transposase-like protein
MEARQRRSFTDDYKRQAVDLVASSGRPIGSVAKELGLRDSVLRRWVEQRGAGLEPTATARMGAESAPPHPHSPTVTDPKPKRAIVLILYCSGTLMRRKSIF